VLLVKADLKGCDGNAKCRGEREAEPAACDKCASPCRCFLRCLPPSRRQPRPKRREHVVADGAQARREQGAHRRQRNREHADQQQRQGNDGHVVVPGDELSNEDLQDVRAARRLDCDHGNGAEHAHEQPHERTLHGVYPEDSTQHSGPPARLDAARAGVFSGRCESLPVRDVNERIEHRQEAQGDQPHAGHVRPGPQRGGTVPHNGWRSASATPRAEIFGACSLPPRGSLRYDPRVIARQFGEARTSVVGSDASISAPAVATGVNSRGDCFGFFAPKLLGTSPGMIG